MPTSFWLLVRAMVMTAGKASGMAATASEILCQQHRHQLFALAQPMPMKSRQRKNYKQWQFLPRRPSCIWKRGHRWFFLQHGGNLAQFGLHACCYHDTWTTSILRESSFKGSYQTGRREPGFLSMAWVVFVKGSIRRLKLIRWSSG